MTTTNWKILKKKLLDIFWFFDYDLFRTSREEPINPTPNDGEYYIWAPIQISIKDGKTVSVEILENIKAEYIVQHMGCFKSEEEALTFFEKHNL